MLFGDYMNQNINKAKEIFEKLAVEGSPKAQTVLVLWKIRAMLKAIESCYNTTCSLSTGSWFFVCGGAWS